MTQEQRQENITRDQLLHAALAQFYERGYLKVSVNDICQRISPPLTKGAFYYYFNSKEEILFEIHDEYINFSMRDIKSIKNTHISAIDMIDGLFKNSLFVLKNMRMNVVVFNNEQRYLTGHYRDTISSLRRAYRDEVVEILDLGRAQGEINPAIDPKIATLNYFGLMNWLYMWYRPEGDLTPEMVINQCRLQFIEGIENKSLKRK